MNRVVLLCLLPPSRTGTRLAGAAEVVETGEVVHFRNAEDLLGLLRRIHATESSQLRPTAEPSHRDVGS
jgi:hypothetical protein